MTEITTPSSGTAEIIYLISHDAEFRRLAKLSIEDYERVRKEAAAKLKFRESILDEVVKRERKKQQEQSTARKLITPPDHETLEQTASEILASNNVLDLFAKEFAKVIAGEAVNGKLLYLVATSRLFDRTMNAAIKGTSAGGKSEIRKRLLEFFPPESIISFTSLSERALIYYDGDFTHKIFSMGEASATDEQDFQDYLLRELMSEGRIRHATVQKVGNELVAVTIEKEGPVAFLVTTTRNKLHAENETRLLSLEIDDTEDQTRAVLGKVAKLEGLNDAAALIDYKRWQDYQRWLETGERRVVVPFADAMAELMPTKAVRLRRDVGQVIRAIKAHALLHRQHRDQDTDGQIVADIEHDYTTVRELMHPILAEGSGVAVNKTMTATVHAVERVTAGLDETKGASGQEIAKALKLDKSAAWRGLSRARNEGLIVNLELRKGLPGKYRVAEQVVEPEPKIDILPEPEELEAHTRKPPPQKPVQPCNRDEIANTPQGDNGCIDGCNHGCNPKTERNPSATGSATVKSMNGQEKSLPVAGLQSFSGGTGVCASMLCIECGDPIRPGCETTVRSTSTGEIAWVHNTVCFDRWHGRE
jgi:hypothetical protein